MGILVTSRREPPEPFTPVQLLPLSAEESTELLERALGSALPLATGTWIYAKAAGNPLYTLEYLRYLTKQGFLWSDGQHWHWRAPLGAFMPATVEALIEQLIGQARSTSETVKCVLEAHALLPGDTSRGLWSKVARVGEDELEAVITALTRQGILQNGAFTHPLFKEVTLYTLPTIRRRDLSRRAINALPDEPTRAALFVAGADLEAAQALELLLRAARAHSDAQAADLLAQAVTYATGVEKGQLALEAARALNGVDYDRTLALAGTAAKYLEPPNEALYLMASVLALQGKHEAVQDLLARFADSCKTR